MVGVLILSGWLPAQGSQTELSIEGEAILLNGVETKLIGLRCSNALYSDRRVDDLIEALDTYRSYGVNLVSVFVMGSRFGDIQGYLPDSSMNEVYRDRLDRILQATDERGMAMIVGCLYWSTSKAKEDLGDWMQADADRAIANTATWLKDRGYRHVILDPDNEGMAVRAKEWSVESMIAAAKSAWPELIVANNTKQEPPNEDLNMHFGKPEVGKPWFDSEATPKNAPGRYWGTFSKETHEKDASYYNYSRIGRYTEEMKADQLRQTQEGMEQYSGHVFASTWIQCPPNEGVDGPFTDVGGRSDLGSNDDLDAPWNKDIDTIHPDAGMLWWLEWVKQHYGPKMEWPESRKSSAETFTMPDSGYLLLEAENLPHSDLWELVEVDSTRVMGRGYLKYIGPVTGSGHGQEIDEQGTLQGDPEDWLVIPVKISEPGRYRINLRNHHLKKDGDNDIWVHVIGYPLPIRRVGDHAVESYQWLTWGPEWVYFDLEEPGVYEFYIAGRSKGFGVDRIAIYNEQAPITLFHRARTSANQQE